MDFARMPEEWPYRTKARMVPSRPHDWCVIEAGLGPTILMLHGAGGSGHSFRALVPHLAGHARLVIPDLPGQGFTRAGNRGRLGVDQMAEDLWRLCATLKLQPTAIIGHSAGAAVALRMAELAPASTPVLAVVGINSALGAFEGAAGVLFPLLARILSLTPLVPTFVSRLWGNAPTVKKLITSTGSTLDPEGLALYLALVRDAGHIDGTLGMMAQWRLEGLSGRLPQLAVPTLLITTSGDKVVPPRVSTEAAERMPDATVVELKSGGHLAHEEDAGRIAVPLMDWLKKRVVPAA